MKLIVLDRDGVINEDSPDFIRSPAQWQPIPGSLEAIAALTRAGFVLAVATNQSGLGRGLFDRSVLNAIHSRMLEAIEAAGGRIGHIAICPHLPDAGCNCRKPEPGMIDEIFARLGRPAAGWMIGDRLSDLAAGQARGLSPILVRTGRGSELAERGGLPQDCRIAGDLGEAASILLMAASA